MGAAQDAGNHWRSAGPMSALRLPVSHPPYFALNDLSSNASESCGPASKRRRFPRSDQEGSRVDRDAAAGHLGYAGQSVCNDDLLIATTVAHVMPKNVTAPTRFGRRGKALDVLLVHGADLNPITKGIRFQGHRIFLCRPHVRDHLRGSPLGSISMGSRQSLLKCVNSAMRTEFRMDRGNRFTLGA